MGTTITSDKTKNKMELKKHSAAIQIVNDISRVQRQAFNTLLLVAREQILREPNKDTFEITFPQLRQYAGIDTKNYDHIISSLTNLMQTVVSYNLLHKDSSYDWGAFVLLSEVKIKDGFIYFSLPPSLRSHLLDPRIYAKINLAITRNLSSKYSLALYELARDYINVSIPKMSIETFRQLMGVNHDQYPILADLRKRVIDPAVNEVNDKTDISIEYAFIKERNKVKEIQLTATEKPITIEKQVASVPDDPLTIIVTALPDSLKLNEKIIAKIQAYLTSHGYDYVYSNVSYALKRAKTNPEAYFVAALDEDFAAGVRAEKKASLLALEKKKKQEEQEQGQEEQELREFHEMKLRYMNYYQLLTEEEQQKILAEINKLEIIHGDNMETKICSYFIYKGIHICPK